jgi:hypothetical protein
MRQQETQFGPCHLCGTFTKRSFEHVPPRSAFNNRRILEARGWEIFRENNPDKVGGVIRQKGAGAYTLCGRCNNDTGSWYGGAFVDWVQQGAQAVMSQRHLTTFNYEYHVYPLRVIKQIICMFFSANGPSFQSAFPKLAKFVLDRWEKHLDPSIRVYAYFNISDRSRQTGIASIGNIESGKMRTVSEITFPPIGFLMTLSCESPDEKLTDISFFSKYACQRFFKYRD